MGTEHFARLGADDRISITVHFLALDKNSRLLRFGTPISDESVARYVRAIDFDRDIVEGVWDDERLVGVAHLGVYTDAGHPVGELGISVLPEARHQHLGQRLLARALLHARLGQLKHVYVQFLVRNRPMARLASAFTDLVDRDFGEACATIDMEERMPIVA
jgi:RimJ/RimL family protein N-acetyltransferase